MGGVLVIRLRLRYLVLVLSLGMLMGGISVGWAVQSNFGGTAIVDVTFPTAESVQIRATLAVPLGASSSNPVPGVVVIHGLASSREQMNAFTIELSRRGFVVLAIDTAGHGDSGGGATQATDRGAEAALQYLDGLPYVSALGLVGHSMGAWMSAQAVQNSSVAVDGLVLIGGGVDPDGLPWANTTYPRNLLVAVGQFDELYQIPSLLASLSPVFGGSPPVAGQLYGTFGDASARKIITPPTDHLFEITDPAIISETVEWLRDSLKGGGADPYWIPKEALIYPAHIIAMFVASAGLIAAVFPLLALLLALGPLRKTKQLAVSSDAVSRGSCWRLALVYAAIGLGPFLPFILMGTIIQFVIPLPQIFALGFGIWLWGSGLVAAGVLLLLRRREPHRSVPWTDLGAFASDRWSFFSVFGLSGLVALAAILWFYAWTFALDVLLGLRFYLFFPLFRLLTPVRLLMVVFYLVLILPFFFVEGLWLMGLLRAQARATWFRTQLIRIAQALFIKCTPYVALLTLQFGFAFLTGTLLFPGLIGFMLLFLWGLLPMLALSTCITTLSYALTNRIYVGAWTNALVISWSIATTFPLA
jgi:pimeloyl-ACP methyl ester carboxylesterase